MTQPLIVVVPTHQDDVDQAESLLKWMKELGGDYSEHSLLVAADAGVPQERMKALLDIVRGDFNTVRAMIIQTGTRGWPLAANLMFRAVARQIFEGYKLPWLWLEPDAVPLTKNWLTDLSAAYRVCPRQFMGCVIDNEKPTEGLPKRYMAGVAVYAQDTFGQLADRWKDAKFTGPTAPKRNGKDWVQTAGAWDMSFADFFVPRAQNTAFIHSHWGTSQSTPPVFKAARTEADPENVVTLDFIKPAARVFHRIKDIESFLALWRVKLGFQTALAVEAIRQPGESSQAVEKALDRETIGVKRGPGNPNWKRKQPEPAVA